MPLPLVLGTICHQASAYPARLLTKDDAPTQVVAVTIDNGLVVNRHVLAFKAAADLALALRDALTEIGKLYEEENH